MISFSLNVHSSQKHLFTSFHYFCATKAKRDRRRSLASVCTTDKNRCVFSNSASPSILRSSSRRLAYPLSRINRDERMCGQPGRGHQRYHLLECGITCWYARTYDILDKSSGGRCQGRANRLLAPAIPSLHNAPPDGWIISIPASFL